MEETACNMEQLTSTVRTNSENTKQASTLAEHALKLAQDGATLSNRSWWLWSPAMNSRKKITDIIGVVDGIAFQADILALKAAVAAAQAGE